jgi:2-(1,2-epoxy-1,2-dihydrophenyl)acetyl-CoA isomerase
VTPSSTVLYEVRGTTALLTLNRPERLNSLTYELMNRMVECLHAAAGDRAVRAVVFTGAGRGFCAGADFDLLAQVERPTSEEAHITRVVSNMETVRLLRRMPKPTIAAINGPCAGAGLAWAAAADLRYMASSAVLTTAFGRAGQSGDFGGTWTLPRLIGEGRARHMYFLSPRLTAAQAAEIGFANEVVSDESLLSHVLEEAQKLALVPPLTIAAMKENLNESAHLPFEEHLNREARRAALAQRTPDSIEAGRALREGRPPVYET